MHTAREMLHSPRAQTRRRARSLLSASRDVAVRLYLELLQDADYPYRSEIAHPLDTLDYKSRIPDLDGFIAHPDPVVRAVGIRRLRKTPSEANLKVLVDALSGPDPAASAAALVLENFADKIHVPVDAIAPHLRSPSRAVSQSVARLIAASRDPMPDILPLLDDPGSGARAAVLLVLRERPVPASVPRVIDICKTDPDLSVRVQAITALATSWNAEAEGALLELAAHPEARIRRAAVRSLGLIWGGTGGPPTTTVRGRSKAEAAVKVALGDASPSVRREACEAVLRLGVPDAVGLVMACLASLGRDTRLGALKAMVRNGGPVAGRLCEEVLRTDGWSWEEQLTAFRGLRELGMRTPEHERLFEPISRREERRRRVRGIFRYRGMEAVSVAWLPAAGADATGVDYRLDVEPTGFDLSVCWLAESGYAFAGLGSARFIESGSRGAVDMTHVDLGFGLVVPTGVASYWHTGPSILALDHEDSAKDMFGLGWYARAGIKIPIIRRVLLDLHADAHGWLGWDDSGAQAAGSTSIGLGLTCAF